MQFRKELRPRVQSGEITLSVRIWQSPRVKVGGRYRLGEGSVEIDEIREIGLDAVSPEMARESGFEGLVDLLKTAKHGAGNRVFVVRFHYVPG